MQYRRSFALGAHLGGRIAEIDQWDPWKQRGDSDI